MSLGTKGWVLALMAAWAAQVGMSPPAFAQGGQTDGAMAAANGGASAAASTTSQSDRDYVIGVADDLDISVWKDPDLSAKGVPVRPDGKIALPLLGDVPAQGFTPSQLAANITEKLRKYMSDPRVNVSVSAVNSRRYYILGEVMRTGAYALVNNMTVLQALSSAGGLTQYAKLKKIYVLRNENGQQVKLPFNYKDVVKGVRVEQNVVLKPGDTIMVP
ncbi:MAG TPA: polysaccharide biosynthesis/export family protein [Terriglobales bacterium]|nr:polysaccharide biosynthesis/export family protein [Terriglobales bacterium]